MTQRDTKDLIFFLDSICILPASFFNCASLLFSLNSPSLCLPPYSHPLYASTWKQQGWKNGNKSDKTTAHSLIIRALSCTHKAILKKTTQPMKKTTRLSNSPPPPSPSLCSFLHSSTKGIPWWPAISESSSAWSYSKLMNWKMNRCRQRERALDPSWRWKSRSSAGDTQVFQAQVYFRTDVGGL